MPAAAPDTRLHPLVALAAVRRLRADPEDTRQVFIICRALRGKSGIVAFNRFKDSPVGRQVLAERRMLLDWLKDSDALAALPDGSVGRAFLAFVQGQNFAPEGLVTASGWGEKETPSDPRLFRERMRDSHDLTHILTGYGRDRLGEICLMVFMNRHARNPGQLLIAALGWGRWSRGWRAAVREAWHNGKKARDMLSLDYEALLAQPLEDVRRELGIAAPARYRDILTTG